MKNSQANVSSDLRLVKIIAHFIGKTSRLPVGGAGFEARLYDADPIHDDFICAWSVAADGSVEIIFDLAECQSLDSPAEEKPDLYLEIQQGLQLLFRAPVQANVEFSGAWQMDGEPDRRSRDLGTFEIPDE